MFFRYFKSLESPEGLVTRVMDADAPVYAEAKKEDGSDKFVEATFQEWWDTSVAEDTKVAAQTSAPEGHFFAEVPNPKAEGEVIMVTCSLADGEPIDQEATDGAEAEAPVEAAPEATPEAPAASEGTEAPAEGQDAPSEGTEGNVTPSEGGEQAPE